MPPVKYGDSLPGAIASFVERLPPMSEILPFKSWGAVYDYYLKKLGLKTLLSRHGIDADKAVEGFERSAEPYYDVDLLSRECAAALILLRESLSVHSRAATERLREKFGRVAVGAGGAALKAAASNAAAKVERRVVIAVQIVATIILSAAVVYAVTLFSKGW